MKTALVTIFCLIISLFAVYGSVYWKVLFLDHKLEEEKKEAGKTTLYLELKALSVLTAVVIEIFNKLMCGWTGSMAKHMRSDTHST